MAQARELRCRYGQRIDERAAVPDYGSLTLVPCRSCRWITDSSVPRTQFLPKGNRRLTLGSLPTSLVLVTGWRQPALGAEVSNS